MQELLFLVSQPRSGSTLLQSLLNSHSEIDTISEPWILLSELFHFTEYVDRSGFDWYEFQVSQERLIKLFSQSKNTYYQAVKSKVEYLYSEIESSLDFKGRYFLDKSPRYYLILNHIRELFPEAKFIILKRNPFNVFCSMFHTWIREDWGRFARHYHDLYSAIPAITNFTKTDDPNTLIIKYEDLTQDPEGVLSGVFQFLDLGKEVIDLEKGFNFNKGSSDEYHGDPNITNAKFRQSIKKSSGDEYLEASGTLKYLLYSYAHSLDEDTLGEFGYPISNKLLKNDWLGFLQGITKLELRNLCLGEYDVNSISFRARKKLLTTLM